VETRSIEAIVRALNEAGVRYLIVGGLAVVAHGYTRLTVDLDMILDLQEDNVRRALAALTSLGYRPKIPVPAEQFADSSTRAGWVREKGMTVFSLFSSQHAATDVDLFAEVPMDFDKALANAIRMEVAPGVPATFVNLEDLVALKLKAGRPQDLNDIQHLRALHEEPKRG
jgi:predicted nucleotidyltransferase